MNNLRNLIYATALTGALNPNVGGEIMYETGSLRPMGGFTSQYFGSGNTVQDDNLEL